MNRLKDTVAKAKQDTARFLTTQIRQDALRKGWDPEVAANIHVIHEEGRFKTSVHPDYADRAHIHEYGTETTRPAAVLRTFAKDTKTIERAFMMSANHHWKGF